MKRPRNISARRLIQALRRLGYQPIRQAGSHIRLMHDGNAARKITVPDHDPIKMGTLNAILDDVAAQLGMTIEALLDALDL